MALSSKRCCVPGCVNSVSSVNNFDTSQPIVHKKTQKHEKNINHQETGDRIQTAAIENVKPRFLTKDSTEVPDCEVLSKKEWDGLSPTHVEYLPRPVDLVIIQHTATDPCTTDSACAQIVQNIQTNHMDSLGFWDIGPNFLIGGNGKLYEGSGWIHVGAHTYGYNRRSIGITFIGNFNKDTPTPEALQAAKSLIACGIERGHLKPETRVVAHKQVLATESPGRKLYAEIRRWPQWVEDVSKIKHS